MSCELTRSVLHGYLDGELDAARAADFEQHLVSCAECVSELEAQERLRSSLDRAALYERAPAALRKKVYAATVGKSGVQPADISRIMPRRWLALAATILIITGLGWRLFLGPGSDHSETALASAIVDAHLRSLQPGHLEDVISSDQHTVKPWFDGKLNFAPTVRDFAEEGFPLHGGRLDVVGGRTVAVLVYARRKHFINVFVWPTTEPDSLPKSGSQFGYHWMVWRKAGMEIGAVSDVNPADLGELQHLLAN